MCNDHDLIPIVGETYNVYTTDGTCYEGYVCQTVEVEGFWFKKRFFTVFVAHHELSDLEDLTDGY